MLVRRGNGDRMRRLALGIAAIVLVVAGCAAPDPYPFHAGPAHASQASVARIGEPARAVLLYLEVRPGDRIELLGAEPIGSFEGADVRTLVSRPVVEDDGSLTIGDAFEELPGTVLMAASPSAGSGNTVGIGVELTARRPGRYEIDGLRLRYRLNGGSDQTREGTDVVLVVCADDPAPSECSTKDSGSM
jgi:hypothetical protein